MKLRILAMILASLLLLPCLFACAEDKPGKDDPSVQEESTEHDPFADMDADVTRRINLSELKFGRNYNSEDI